MSIRLRLTITIAALLVVILFAFGLAVIGVANWALLDSLDRKLDETIAQVISSIQGPIPSIGLPSINIYQTNLDIFSVSSVYIQVWNLQGILIDRSNNLGSYSGPLDAGALIGQDEIRRQVTIYDTPLRVLTRPILIDNRFQGRVQVAMSMEPMLEAVGRVALIMMISGLVALALALLVVGGLLTRALRPIEVIATTASQIATGESLNRRIPYNGPPDELGQLTNIFNNTLDRLEMLFKAQRRFVADVSHELRTPLTVIQANVELIDRYGPDPDSLAALTSESKRMARLVADLLLLAQADAGELPLLKETVELDTVVMEVFKQAQVLEQAHPEVMLGRFEPVRVQGDYDRLKQLLINLVSNALKHTPNEGEVSLAVWPQGHHAVFSVTDNGAGIPEKDLPNIFDRFYRVDKARARDQGGTGLGLSIAQWIAEAHGGKIEVSSKLNVGTTFTVRLPTAPGTPVFLREANHAPPAPSPKLPQVEEAEKSKTVGG